MVIRLPALRERPEDVAVIGSAFVEEALVGISQVDRTPILRWLASAEARRHGWPGNVRELRNVVRSLLLGLPVSLNGQSKADAAPSAHFPERVRDGQASQREVEDWYRAHVLRLRGGNVTQAARVLGVDRSTVARHQKQNS
jgi:DNA-binding NtrC family response regulator